MTGTESRLGEQVRQRQILASIARQLEGASVDRDDLELRAVREIAVLKRDKADLQRQLREAEAQAHYWQRQAESLEALIEEPDILDAVFGDTPPVQLGSEPWIT